MVSEAGPPLVTPSWASRANIRIPKAHGSKMKARIAKEVSEIAKVIPLGLSSVFQLVVVGTRLVVMYKEANRGCRKLPGILTEGGNLLQFITRCIAPIVKAGMIEDKAEAILEDTVFESLVSSIDLMGEIEEQMMRTGWGRMLNSNKVAEVEAGEQILKQ